MKKLHIPNEFVEWVVIILGVTVAALSGAGIKSWLDNVLADSGVIGWVPGVVGIVLFFVLAAPIYYWVARSARHRGEPTASTSIDEEVEA